jgi:hypothetical protein
VNDEQTLIDKKTGVTVLTNKPPLDLKKITGVKNDDFATNLLSHATAATFPELLIEGTDQESLESRAGLMAAAIEGVGPTDEIEGMLAAQMIVIHHQALDLMMRACEPAVFRKNAEFDLNMANKLLRTFTGHVECLNRHRGKGQQKVTVEHVNVEAGGQAFVGNIEGRGREGGAK